ncbi:hypothetical protein T040910_198 [Synechococcus phage S-CAM3]|uniref:Gp164 n=1 Tax=Synechococcus phage S-CAM3 TaxID=1883366 RepID=A0A1D8KJ88_9CAUD|nr:hypothetical protein BOW87_gp060 [Synechococcus phage S-CAM3]AOV58702.1 hypothetical protein S250808_197 [Synechococcus phage S-CAM3]AOV58942.1 hypothetical protein T040910_198 [Synechococcus phage S-CAM3]AOV59181.1 hypothetical protein C421010_198 [Synechococcus phage S-CAM3]
MDIPEIQVRDLGVGPIDIWVAPEPRTPAVPPIYPVTTQIGVPIVDMPGCVEAHEANQDDNFKVNEDDPKGVKVFCDAGVPSFNPIDYNRSRLKMSGERPVPEFKGQMPDNTVDTPKPEVSVPKVSAPIPECPTDEQLSKEPLGFIFDSGRKIITGYELSPTGQCLRIVEDVPIIEQAINGIPPASVVITTGGIAVVATTSALLAKPFADILLKVIKPTVKKVLKKVASIRGKSLKVQSSRDRQVEQRQRNAAIRALRVGPKVKK